MIPAWAADYVGLPFLPHGRDREGLDCWGLYRLVRGERWGEWLDEFGGAYSDAAAARAVAIADRRGFATVVRAGDERLGDAVFLRVEGVVGHLGMVLGAGMMLHVRTAAGAAVEPYRTGAWARRVEGFRRP